VHVALEVGRLDWGRVEGYYRRSQMDKRLWIVLSIALAVFLVGCATIGIIAPSPTPTVALTAGDLQRITAAEAHALVSDGTALLYDARSLRAYQNLHAGGAISFPEADVAARYGELPADEALIFY
jgi:photosystem II stability/assembly factor-like uncharacterized protein